MSTASQPRRTRATASASLRPALDARLALQLWALADAFDRRLSAELAPMGLTIPGFRLIGELLRAPEGLRVGTLAERLRVKAPSVCGMVDRFEAQGLVERIPDPDDARASRVRLATDASLGQGTRVLERLDACLVAGASATEQAAIRRHLAQLTVRLLKKPERP